VKIEGPRAAGSAGSARKTGSAAAPGFSLPTSGASAAAPAAPVAAAMAVDALIALQVDASDPQRRGRQARRGRATLDALEKLQHAALLGEAPHSARLTLVKLQSEMELTGDPGLDAVLAEIDTRAAVELAKLDMAELAAARKA
jgi:hypothetical protein